MVFLTINLVIGCLSGCFSFLVWGGPWGPYISHAELSLVFNKILPYLSKIKRSFDKEVRAAIGLMEGDKALRSYGFPSLFYKVCWDLIKNNLI